MRYTEFTTLLEYDRSKTEQALSNSIVKAAQRDSYLKSQNSDDPSIVKAVIDRAEQTDPTQNKQFVQWIIRQFTKQGMRFEDMYKLEKHLETFTSTRGQHKRLGINSDINQYDWRKLADTARKLSNTDVADPESADISKVEDARILYDGPLGTLSIPETEAASCELGRGTEWCTAATKSENKFDDYNKKGPLYIWIDKKRKTKYQFHFETGQIMDIHDDPVTGKEVDYLVNQNPITKKILKQNVNITLDKYTEYLDYYAELPEADYYDFLGHEEPDQEILEANIEVVLSALDDKDFSLLNTSALTDSSKEVDYNNFKQAWLSELSKRPQLHEELAKRQPFRLPITYATITGSRSAEMEKALLSAQYNTRAVYIYVDKIVQGAWPEAEAILAQDPVHAFRYAVYVLKDRFPAGEPEIRKHERLWKQYQEMLDDKK